MSTSSDLRYPVGKFQATPAPSPAQRAEWFLILADFPFQMRAAVADLSEAQLNWPYRPEGWTIRQVVHHCADSHLNAFTRFKLALTEDSPRIKPYDEAAWAELPDTAHTPVAASLSLLEGLHARWFVLLANMSADAFERRYLHPDHSKPFSLSLALDLYQWHARHHLAHVAQAKRLHGGL